ncbi:fused DSP-PTPase phosphatase/NAD kinase-like protein [Clostridium vincentii]|uniref:Effector protein hopD2 n=1 Tax=Clostridium vincentii TaxID=52704 RepID=A0A2T0BEZ5_9CLOT|nr:phytase [Clostridium vincentii]PRR82402.1 Effector protein hopD2 [Clostridium vincentii]
MRKRLKVTISILLILLSALYSLVLRNEKLQDSYVSLGDNNINLILDSLNYNDMPRNFRKSSNLIHIQNNKILNLSGLDSLNISGSQQFSECNLPLIINSIGTPLPITIIDLRQESHGFINGDPISWSNLKNDDNKGLTNEQVLLDETKKLNSIKLNKPIIFYNHADITTIPAKISNENQLINSEALSYTRIPVLDGKIPRDDMVDYFIELTKSQPENTWIHFHCKEGIGRTTLFMIMYDMIKNSQEVLADDIINRQLLLANFDEDYIKSFCNDERVTFLQNFYKYCKEQGETFNMTWSDWEKSLNAN